MSSVALITGASQGIGKATAILFAQKGYDLILTARQPDRLEALAGTLRDMECRALAVPADMADEGQVDGVVRKALETLVHIDVLVNNAGICMSGGRRRASMWVLLED